MTQEELRQREERPRVSQEILTLQDPPVARALFGEPRWSWIWLIIRLYVGYEWLIAGYDKIINPVWVGSRRFLAAL